MTTPAPADPTVAPRTRLIRTPNERVFLHVLVNTAAANITTSYLWFALTFWVYLVTLLVPEERHANANGLVGTVQGIAFIITSVFSGLSVGPLGMGWTLLIAIVATAIAGVHLLLLRIPEEQPAASVGRGVDLRGYFVWSLLDNFEWGYGYAKRFGIVRVDFNTLERTVKDSGRWYQQLVATHRIPA